MRRFRKFLALERPQQRLLFSAALELWRQRIALWFLPSARVRDRLGPRGGAASTRELGVPKPGAPSPREIARAVVRAARLVPQSTCLVQAIAAHTLCGRHGHESRVALGTMRTETGEFVAHAWLEVGEEVLIGGEELERYTPLEEAGESS